MKTALIAFAAAVVVCMLIEFRNKLFGLPEQPGTPAPRTGFFVKILGVLILFLVAVPVAVSFFVDDNEAAKPMDERALSPVMKEEILPRAPRSMKPADISTPGQTDVPMNKTGVADSNPGEPEERAETKGNESLTAAVSPETMAANPVPPEKTAPDEEVTVYPVTKRETGQAVPETGKMPKEPAAQAMVEDSPEAVEEPSGTSPDDTPASPDTAALSGVSMSMDSARQETPAPESKPSEDVMIVSDNGNGHPVTILIGSYPTREKAFEVASHFSAGGDPAFTSFYTDPYEGSRYQVFMGNYESMDDASGKARELRERNFRQVDVTSRMFAVHVGDCSSYQESESIKGLLREHGYIAYGHGCPEITGHIRILVGAFLNDQFARDTALEIKDRGIGLPVAVVLR